MSGGTLSLLCGTKRMTPGPCRRCPSGLLTRGGVVREFRTSGGGATGIQVSAGQITCQGAR